MAAYCNTDRAFAVRSMTNGRDPLLPGGAQASFAAQSGTLPA